MNHYRTCILSCFFQRYPILLNLRNHHQIRWKLCFVSIPGDQIATNFCTYAKFWNDALIRIWISAKRNFHHIWIVMDIFSPNGSMYVGSYYYLSRFYRQTLDYIVHYFFLKSFSFFLSYAILMLAVIVAWIYVFRAHSGMYCTLVISFFLRIFSSENMLIQHMVTLVLEAEVARAGTSNYTREFNDGIMTTLFLMTLHTRNSMVSCQKGPIRHAYAWQLGPFWQDTLELTPALPPPPPKYDKK